MIIPRYRTVQQTFLLSGDKEEEPHCGVPLESIRHSSIREEVLLPIGIIQVGITAGRTAVNHVMIPNVDAHMRNAVYLFTHGARKEHKITRLHFVLCDRPAQAVQASCTEPPSVVNA